MKIEDLKGLKYYLGLALIVFGFYAYSASVGWRWIGGTRTEETRSHTTGTHGGRYLYHK